MTMPMTILEIELLIALLCTAYLWFGRDQNNYTDIISGIISIIFWFLTAMSFLIGVVSDGIVFVSTALFFVFLAIGIIVAIITIVRIIDSLSSRKTDSHIGDFDIGRI
jgi:hypothetical protein